MRPFTREAPKVRDQAAVVYRPLPACPREPGQVDELVIEMSPRRSALNAVCELVEKFGQANGVPPAAVHRVNLEIDELLTNYVVHGLHGADEAGRMVVRVRLVGSDDRKFVLIVLDSGPPFDPRNVEAPPEPESLDDIPLGGVGIHLVRQYADRLLYREINGCNLLRLEHGVVCVPGEESGREKLPDNLGDDSGGRS